MTKITGTANPTPGRLNLAGLLRDAVWELCKEMEVQELTKIELDFDNGFKVTLMNPKAHEKLLKGERPYPEQLDLDKFKSKNEGI